ncbi:MAG: hypothetical protein KDD33_01985 [Bdellovibrionales bacterium]|nr:hypothetical protein [Bdellovibrionales bacterium]
MAMKFLMLITTLTLVAGHTLAAERDIAVLKLPENYLYFQKKMEEEAQIIPEKAKDASSPETFVSTVFDFHLQKFLKENPDSSLAKMKNLEQSINESAKIEGEDFKLRSKLNLSQLSAEVEMEYLLKYRFWFANEFRDFNAEVELFKINNSQIALEHQSKHDENRTTLGIKYVW